MSDLKNLVYLDNKLAQASYTLNLSEQRLIFMILGRINQGYKRDNTKHENYMHEVGKITTQEYLSKQQVKGDVFDSNTLFTITVADFAKVCNLQMTDARKELQEACDNLFNRYFHIKEANGSYEKFRWIRRIKFDTVTDSIGIYWSDDIVPYIKDLESYFVRLQLEKLFQLNSTYSWKLFTILSSKKGENKYKGFQKISVEDLMFMLDVPTSCKEFKHFNNLILKKVAKEFQSKLGLGNFSIEFEKEGRFVKQVVFKGFVWKETT